MRRESDMGIGHVVLLHERQQVVDYTPILYVMENGLVTRKLEETPNYANIAKPFSATLWLLFLGTLLAATLSLVGMALFLDDRRKALELGFCIYKILVGESKSCRDIDSTKVY